MYLFLDGVSTQAYIGLYTTKRQLVAKKNFHIAGNESRKAGVYIHTFLQEHDLEYKDIENIISVVGPGSFTGVRTLTLIVNTLAYVYPHIYLTACNFFDLYSHYPIVKSSSKNDLFVKYKDCDIIQVVKNEDFESLCDSDIIYGDTNIERFKRTYSLYSSIDYDDIIKDITLGTQKRVSPIYIKKPNIS